MADQAPTLPDPEFAGSATEYLKQQPMREQQQADANEGSGGLFGDSIGAKVARGMLYMIPVAGQIVDAKERAVVANKHQVNQLILNAALKGKDPALLQDPTVQKAAQGLFGKGGQAFLGVAHHVLSSEIAGHNDWIATMQKHGYGQPGVNPADAMNAAAAEFIANKKAIPKEAQSLITQFAYKPAIGAATQEATRPGKVQTAAEEAQARENVKLNPENVGGEAAAGAYKAGEKTKAVEEAKDPYIQRRADAAVERKKAAEGRAEGRQLSKEGRAADQQNAKAMQHILNAAEVSKLEATDAAGHPVQLVPDQSTVGDLHNLLANGGNVRAKETGLLSTLGFSAKPTTRLTHIEPGAHGDPVNDYLKRWDH